MGSRDVTVLERAGAHADVLTQMGAALASRVEAISDAMARAIHTAIEGLPEDLHRDTYESCRGNLALICAQQRDGVGYAEATPPAEAVHYVRECVHHGVPLAHVLRAYRIGHALMWSEQLDWLTEHVADPDALTPVLHEASAWLFGWIDAMSVPLSTAYLDERDRWVRSAAAVRADEVHALLTDGDVDAARASSRLGYELGRRHIGFVVWRPPGVGGPDLEDVAHAVGRSLGDGTPLVVPQAGRVISGWAGTRSDRSPDLTWLAEVVERGSAHVAVGEAIADVPGFRLTHEQALTARRVASLHPDTPRVTRFDEVALPALLTSDGAAARAFVARELGELASPDPTMRRLAQTLRVHLEEGQSFVRAGRRLGVHSNTVTYRVRRACEVLGRDCTERQLELRIALLLADLTTPAASA